MRQQFLEVNTIKEAKELAPWAADLIEVDGGFRAYESMSDASLVRRMMRQGEWIEFAQDDLIKENGGKGKLEESAFVWSEGIDETSEGLIQKYWAYSRELYEDSGETITFETWMREVEKIQNITPAIEENCIDED